MSRISLLFLVGAIIMLREYGYLGQAQIAPPPPPPTPAAAGLPATDRERFAIDLLASLGNVQPTPGIVAFVVTWTVAEDGSGGALNRNNPLNTTLCGHNQTGAINGDGACGVAGYATYQDGIEATRDTLLQQNFSEIREALQANDANGARLALWASPWAESHYGYGASWPANQEVLYR